jgi:hypothetical protein
VAEADAGRWIHPGVEVRPSTIAGRGWFARVDLPVGTRVLHLAAEPDEGRVDRLGERFPNHACDPNLGWSDAQSMVTIVDVEGGSELVTDYAMSITDRSWFLRCHCPSYRCRQMVEGTDWQIPQLQRRYAGRWAPRVARLLAAADG